MINDGHLSNAQVEAVAGLAAGTLSTALTHPLDLIKIRMQLATSAKTSSTPITSFTILESLLAKKRPVRVLYRALTPSLIGSGASWALFFTSKNVFETKARTFSRFCGFSSTKLTPWDSFLVSGAAAMFTTTVTSPIWVLKTRMAHTFADDFNGYRTTWTTFNTILKNEGPKAFFKGLIPGYAGTTHAAVQFSVYDTIKSYWVKHLNNGEDDEKSVKLSTTANLITSTIAKVVAGVVTYPHQPIRSRMQVMGLEKEFGTGLQGVILQLYRIEGIKGFYRGIGPSTFRVLPATWILFITYEEIQTTYLTEMGNGCDKSSGSVKSAEERQRRLEMGGAITPFKELSRLN